MTCIVRGKKIIFVDNDESLKFLIDKDFIRFEGRKNFIIKTKNILDNIILLERYKRLSDDYRFRYETISRWYTEETGEIVELEKRIRDCFPESNDTIPIGVRVQKYLLDRAKAVDYDFNLSIFVRCALLKKYGNFDKK